MEDKQSSWQDLKYVIYNMRTASCVSLKKKTKLFYWKLSCAIHITVVCLSNKSVRAHYFKFVYSLIPALYDAWTREF